MSAPSPGGARNGAWHSFRLFPRMLPFLRPHRRLATVSVSLIGASVAVGLAAPWPLAIVIDSVLSDKPLPPPLEPLLGDLGRHALLAVAAIGGLLLTAVAFGLGVVDSYVNTKLNLRVVLDLRSALYTHVQRLSLLFHDRVRTGQVMFRINQQATSVGAAFVTLPPLAESLLTVVGMLTVALFIDWQIALLSLVVVPLIIYASTYYVRRIEPRIYEVRSLESASQSTMYEGLSMIRVILAFAREPIEFRRWRSQAQMANEARIRLTLRQTLFSLVVGTTTAAGTALVIWVGALNVLEGRLTLGELVVLLGYIAAIYKPMSQISATLSQLQQHFINFESTLEILDTPVDVEEAADAIEMERARGAIVFDRVHFDYAARGEGAAGPPAAGSSSGRPGLMAVGGLLPSRSSREATRFLEHPAVKELAARARTLGLDAEDAFTVRREPALQDVSFEVGPGQHVGIVGPTGAGKTTLTSLLLRFYDPTAGAILLDGVDLRRLTLTSLRRQISVVLQDPMLFAGTIGENIRYGRLEATDADVVDAARAANAHGFISGLPEGYDTLVGERGSQLSGGERQRISVARAFLKDAPILVLDEPTSSIDSQTESVILATLERLMAGRTTFTVAHRLSTIRDADLILVLDGGRLVQRGSHDELMADEGLYRRLHDAQTGRGARGAGGAARHDVSRDRPAPRRALMLGQLLVPAVVELLEDGDGRPLRALFETMPAQMRQPSWWQLIAGVLALVRDGSDTPLRRIAAQRRDPRPDVLVVAQVAASLLASGAAVRAKTVHLRDARSLDAEPLDPDRLLREPWTAIEAVSPAVRKELERLLPPAPVDALARDRVLATVVQDDAPSRP